MFQIQRQTEGMEWFYYVDKTVTIELMDQMCKEFLRVLEKCPARVKKQIKFFSSRTNQRVVPVPAVPQPHKPPGGSFTLHLQCSALHAVNELQSIIVTCSGTSNDGIPNNDCLSFLLLTWTRRFQEAILPIQENLL